MSKGIIRTILDDHRDAAIYRHAMESLYLKIKGDYVGKTAKHEDETGRIQLLYREVDKLIKRSEDLEAIYRQHNGRSPRLIESCDQKLRDCFYFLKELSDLPEDEILKRMSDKLFFLPIPKMKSIIAADPDILK